MDDGKKGIPPGLIERRKNPRYFLKLPFDYRRVGTPKFHPGHTLNFCDGGLMIAGTEPIEAGAEIEIKIYFGSSLDLGAIPAIARVVRVVWTDMQTDGAGFIHFGVSFLRISSKDLERLKTLLKK